ncbi:CHC2 zinc finger domain-containing protein, partial [Acinetobacter sp.]
MAIPQHTIDQILDRTDIVDVIGQFVKLKKTGRTYSGCCPFHQEKSPSFHVYRDKQYFHCFGCQANGNAIRFLMDIGSRNFIEVMKDLSSQTGIELPKDNHDSNKLKYKREAPKPKAPAQIQPPAQPAQQAADAAGLSPAPAFEHDPFAEFQAQDDAFYGHDPFAAFSQPPAFEETAQDGNLYDLLESIAQFYERQLPHSQNAQKYFRQRGLSRETIAYWRLGYAPEDWQHLE